MKVYDSSEVYALIKNCRTCESQDLCEILDLGVHPLANSLLDSIENHEVTAPLVLIRCNACTTIQLSINVKPELMFQKYLWVTGTTETARNHCRELGNKIVQKSERICPRVLEIGSNDGTLLGALIDSGAGEVIGVDPASNLQPKHLGERIRLVEGFFGSVLAENLSRQLEKVDVVVARNVLSHVPNLNEVMEGIRKLIADDGIIVIEFHEASKILTELHYESIYHEHTFYHSIKSVQAALSQIGFTIFDISESPISGGSHVVFASRGERESTDALKNALELEESKGVYLKSSWENFAKKVLENLEQLREIFESEKNARWAAFGASARSSTLLNTIGESSRCLNQIADNNPLKQGKYSPGIKLLICDPRLSIDSSIEKVFICAFNFEEEIRDFLRDELQWSGEIILPLPNTIRRYRI
jgi:SAM-dependent methyltransferase